MFEHTIYRAPGLDLSLPNVCREAVRAIILRRNQLLMVHLTVTREYKFPGGGVQTGESHQQALTREALEEAGAHIRSIGELAGVITEYGHAYESPDLNFKMTSYYYFCRIQPYLVSQKLDDYEVELGFEPCWTTIEDALQANRLVRATPGVRKSEGLNREIFALQQLVDETTCQQ